MQAYLKLDHIDKTFTRGNAATEVLKDINLTIGKGEYVSIIGHSGCGKCRSAGGRGRQRRHDVEFERARRGGGGSQEAAAGASTSPVSARVSPAGACPGGRGGGGPPRRGRRPPGAGRRAVASAA